MARIVKSAVCASAAVAAAWVGSRAFAVAGGRAVDLSHIETSQRFLGSSTMDAPQDMPQGTNAPLSMCATLGLLAGAAVTTAFSRRAKAPAVVRQAMAWEGELTVPETFAGGLVGSEYAGFGEYQWDPAELSSRYPEHLPWYRESELKHGRVAMLAYVGLVVPDFVRLPFAATSDPSLDFMNAHNKLIGPGLGEGPMWYLLVFCGIVESLRFKQLGLGFEKLTLANAGDLDFGKGFLPKTEPALTQMKIKELKNGRLAMLAVSGALTSGVTWEVHHFPFAP